MKRTDPDRRARLGLEALDGRIVPAVVLSAGTLTVTGTARADALSVTASADGSRLTVSDNGQVRSFSSLGVGRIVVSGKAGDDRIELSGPFRQQGRLGGDGRTFEQAITVDGGAGNDFIRGTAGNEELLGGDGNDTILPAGGRDLVQGGAGTDTLDFSAETGFWAIRLDYAEVSGRVTSTGGGGTYGVSTTDYAVYAPDNENVIGSQGDDEIVAQGPQFDLSTWTAFEVNNVISGGGGNDRISGNGGDDTIDGGAGNDFIFGNDGDDKLSGGAGNDTLVGGKGFDELRGGDGDDDLDSRDYTEFFADHNGGAVNEIVDGGAGTDRASVDRQETGPSRRVLDRVTGVEFVGDY